jgi:hypothetical protein
VFFSLARNSPSLQTFGFSPADILRMDFGQPVPTVFADHDEMGLLFDDNVDAINFWALIDDSAIATIEFYTSACYPDCNGDGLLDISDFGCFNNKFLTGSPYADCNGDGILDISDYGCFTNAFIVGCP